MSWRDQPRRPATRSTTPINDARTALTDAEDQADVAQVHAEQTAVRDRVAMLAALEHIRLTVHGLADEIVRLNEEIDELHRIAAELAG